MRTFANDGATALAESVAVPAGREEIGHLPLLAGHLGSPPDLILHWNDMTEVPTGVDVVVHFHGYSSRHEHMSLARDKEPFSGLDFSDPDAAPGATSGRSRPTLGVLPRGNYAGAHSGNRNRYDFPALVTPTGLRALVDFSLSHFASRISVRRLELRRLLLTAHSGGGAAMLRALQYVDPDEIHVFDALYQAPNQLVTWARQRMKRDLDALTATTGDGRGPQGALRVLYIPGTDTAGHSIAVARALAAIGAGRQSDRVLAARFRVERTTVEHREIPRRFGWRFLANPAGDVPGVASATREDIDEQVPVVEDYRPTGGRAHVPAAMKFRCAPSPAVVDSASQLPERTATPDDAIRTALGRRLSSAQVTAFDRGQGFQPLRALAAAFGGAMLSELVARLRYSPAQILHPPTTDRGPDDTRARLGIDGPPLLAARLLLTIPGHFRELARRSPRPSEAFVLESLGWLLMVVVRDEIAAATRHAWWVPPAPGFVGKFPTTPIQLSREVQTLVRGQGIVDPAVTEEQLRARFRAWRDGMPGRQWRLETATTTSTAGAGRPFYAELVQIPAPVDVAPARARVKEAWLRRVKVVEDRLGVGTAASINELISCASGLPSGLMQSCRLRGLVMAKDYPQHADRATVTEVPGVLPAVEPLFGQVLETIFALGWNDLLFHTAGAGCFRGKKRPKDKNNPRLGLDPAGARELSEHSVGIAVDFNSMENQQPGAGSMDPRIVAVFETLRFKWGRCFKSAPDPMHFEYCGATCERQGSQG